MEKVSDTGTDQGFKDGTNTGNDYAYDLNGNLIADANKEITGIKYNHLNLPEKIVFRNNDPAYSTNPEAIFYIYDATGKKLKKIVNDQANITETQYSGSYIYENNILKQIVQPEGYIEPDDNGNFDYIYQYKDHLGNVRLSYKQGMSGLEIVEEHNYYPFGLQHKGYNNVVNGSEHPYKFNGKEHQEELGLDWYDFQARNYDPALGRWMNIDPLAEQMRRHSPYNYAFDNPIYFIDPDGMKPQGPPIRRDKDGKIVYVTNGSTTNVKHDSGSRGSLEVGYIFADDGTPIQVFNNTGGADEGFCTNCHGTTFADGQYWVNNEQVPALIEGDGYEEVSTVKDVEKGDKVVYLSKDGEAEHSVTVSKEDGTVEGLEVEGLGGLETEPHTDKVTKAWPSAAGAAIFRKNTPDKVVDDKEIQKMKESVYPDKKRQE